MKNVDTTKLLFTPGPLTTHVETRSRCLVDIGSRDGEFSEIIERCLSQLADISFLPSSMVTVLMQGPATFSIESCLGTLVGSEANLLVVSNGVYGKRIYEIASKMGKQPTLVEYDSEKPICIESFRELIEAGIHTHVAVVHCETTYGVVNDLEAMSDICRKFDVRLIVDGTSSFFSQVIHLLTRQ
jgi:2-aminoethylphosphonate-pyruvate transaminase